MNENENNTDPQDIARWQDDGGANGAEEWLCANSL